ncbi:MAG: tRNA (adenosine(37)-N6)-dimethylallyltransferase MiaA [Deltaproteobacteria bacterium]|nr:tRNA (adenosine(37)-N6)-dimethylallyltransferase MiaA [Deltaproteobacteria bacterium]MCX7953300.1 tRNA (adenosine(37)-N6)-dimethylallyltransferase MiaA [Deltaproteobacteria bacterium]
MNSFNEPVKAVIIFAPTASGKTELAIKLAKKFNTEIISLDSCQIYKDLTICSCAPTVEQLLEVRHHLVQIYPPNTRIDAASISDLAFTVCSQLNAVNRIPIVVGGSFMYIKFFIHGYIKDFKLDAELNGNYEALKMLDPEYALTVNPNDKVRINRALKFILQNARRFSEAIKEHRFQALRVMPLIISPVWERSALYLRIEKRCQNMLESGLLNEVKTVFNLYGEEAWGLKKTIGYKYFIEVIKGNLTTGRAFELLVRDTKRFARQQFYYLKNEPQKRGYTVLPGKDDYDFPIVEISQGKSKIFAFKLTFNDLVSFVRNFDFRRPTVLCIESSNVL